MQMAKSDPAGPVYLTGAREVLEENVENLPDSWGEWALIEQSSLPKWGLDEIVCALLEAQNPL